MGRPKKVGSPAFTVTPAAQHADEEPQDPTAQAADVLEELEDEGQRPTEGRIYRIDPTTRKTAMLDTVDASVIDETYLRENYGGGDYSIYFWGPKRDGSWGYLKGKGKRYRIDSSIPFKGAPRDRAINAAQNGTGTPAPGGGSIMDMGFIQLLKGMQDTSALQAQMGRDHSTAMMAMMERLAAPRENGGGIKDLIVVLTPLLAPLLSGVMERKDPVELATQIAQLAKSGENKSGLSSLHELLEIKDLLGAFGGAPESEDAGWMRLLEKVVPGAIEILKNESQKTGRPLVDLARTPPVARITAPATAPSPVPISPSPASASSVAAPSPSSDMTSPPIQDEWTGLEPHMQTLANMAAQNREPYGVMQTIKTLAPPQMLAAVRELVARDDALDTLLARFPVLQPYRAWTDQLLDEFFAEFFPDQVEDEPPAGAGEGEPSDGVSS